MKHVLLSLSGDIMPKRDEWRGDREFFDKQAGKEQHAKCGSIWDYTKMDHNIFAMLNLRVIPEKLSILRQKDEHIFFFCANGFPVSFGSYIFHTGQKYSLVFIGYREKSWNI